MTNRDLVKELYKENKAINRNIQHLINIGLIGLFGNVGQEAKKKNDEVGKNLAKIGLVLIAVEEVLLLISNIVDYKKARVEDKID